MASASFIFHCSATSFARGSSGLGALSNAWIDSSTVRICNAGLHLSKEVETVSNNIKVSLHSHFRSVCMPSKNQKFFF